MTDVISEGRAGGCWGWWRSGAIVALLPFPGPSLSGSLERMQGQRPHLKGSDRWGLGPNR